MRFFTLFIALAATANAVFAAPAPVPAPLPGATPCPESEHPLLSRRGNDFQAMVATFQSWTPDHRRQYLLSINPDNVHLSQDIRQQIMKVPQVKSMLNGKDLTNEMIVNWLRALHQRN